MTEPDYSAKSANIQQSTCPPAHLARDTDGGWWLTVGPIQGGPYDDMDTALALFRRLVETADEIHQSSVRGGEEGEGVP